MLQALGEVDTANTAYSTALALYQQLPEGWISWGSHCDQMYHVTRNTAWLDYAVTCYLQARCTAPPSLPPSPRLAPTPSSPQTLVPIEGLSSRCSPPLRNDLTLFTWRRLPGG